MHGNARSSPLGRLGMVLRVREGEPVAQVARGMGVSRQCVSKWVRRYREEGRADLKDRSSRPRCSPCVPARRWRSGCYRRGGRLGRGPVRLSVFMGAPEWTVSRILRRHGILRLCRSSSSGRRNRRRGSTARLGRGGVGVEAATVG